MKITAIAISLCCASFSAGAQEPPPPPPDSPPPPASPPPPPVEPAYPAPPPQARPRDQHRHVGFFLRADLGLGYLSSSESAGNETLTISGAAGFGGLAIGGALSENNILAVHIIDAVSTNPNVSSSAGGSSSTSNTTVTLWGIGAEYTRYIMPANVYLSGTLALTRMTVESNGNSADTNWGVGGRLALGKEWWVSDHWGLGLAAHLTLSTNEDPTAGGSNSLTTFGIAAVFSATYN
jgi:hypothetical protein